MIDHHSAKLGCAFCFVATPTSTTVTLRMNGKTAVLLYTSFSHNLSHILIFFCFILTKDILENISSSFSVLHPFWHFLLSKNTLHHAICFSSEMHCRYINTLYINPWHHFRASLCSWEVTVCIYCSPRCVFTSATTCCRVFTSFCAPLNATPHTAIKTAVWPHKCCKPLTYLQYWYRI